MEIGLTILNGLEIYLGQHLDSIIQELDVNKIKYKIPYNKSNDDKANVIIFIETFGVELRTLDNRIVYIKTSNNHFNLVTDEVATMTGNKLKHIRKKLAEKLSIEPSSIRIDRFEIDTLRSIMSVPYVNNTRVRISMTTGMKGGIYIETMQVLTK